MSNKHKNTFLKLKDNWQALKNDKNLRIRDEAIKLGVSMKLN